MKIKENNSLLALPGDDFNCTFALDKCYMKSASSIRIKISFVIILLNLHPVWFLKSFTIKEFYSKCLNPVTICSLLFFSKSYPSGFSYKLKNEMLISRKASYFSQSFGKWVNLEFPFSRSFINSSLKRNVGRCLGVQIF